MVCALTIREQKYLEVRKAVIRVFYARDKGSELDPLCHQSTLVILELKGPHTPTRSLKTCI